MAPALLVCGIVFTTLRRDDLALAKRGLQTRVASPERAHGDWSSDASALDAARSEADNLE